MVVRLLISGIVDDAEAALNEGKYARDVEVEAKADQDVVLNLHEVLVADEVALLEQLRDVPQAWLLLLFDFPCKSEGHNGEEAELELLHVFGADHVKVAVHYGDRREEGLQPERTNHEDLEQ